MNDPLAVYRGILPLPENFTDDEQITNITAQLKTALAELSDLGYSDITISSALVKIAQGHLEKNDPDSLRDWSLAFSLHFDQERSKHYGKRSKIDHLKEADRSNISVH